MDERYHDFFFFYPPADGEKAEYYRSMRKYGFCTYVRSLTNQINAVIHSRMSDSLGYTWRSCVGDDLHAERVGEQNQSYRSKV